jgi:hypothetical protein
MSQQCLNGRLPARARGAFRGECGGGPPHRGRAGAPERPGDQEISHEPVGRQFLLLAPVLAGGALLQWNGTSTSATISARHDLTAEGAEGGPARSRGGISPVPVAAMTGARLTGSFPGASAVRIQGGKRNEVLHGMRRSRPQPAVLPELRRGITSSARPGRRPAPDHHHHRYRSGPAPTRRSRSRPVARAKSRPASRATIRPGPASHGHLGPTAAQTAVHAADASAAGRPRNTRQWDIARQIGAARRIMAASWGTANGCPHRARVIVGPRVTNGPAAGRSAAAEPAGRLAVAVRGIGTPSQLAAGRARHARHARPPARWARPGLAWRA